MTSFSRYYSVGVLRAYHRPHLTNRAILRDIMTTNRAILRYIITIVKAGYRLL